MKLLDLLKPKPPQPTIDSYGEPNNVNPQEVQLIMEWLFASLLHAEYLGKSHLIWYNSDYPDPSLEKLIKKIHRDEPIFLYRCGNIALPLPQEHYWRMMSEHPSMRVYQLETKDE